MTRLERIKGELDRLIAYRSDAMKQNNLFLLESIQEKIKNKEKELQQAKEYAPMRLLDFLNDKGEDVKNKVYKALIKISLASDYVAKCAYDAKDLLKEIGVNDYSLKSDIEALRKVSDKIAAFVCVPNQQCLTDMLVENDEFIDTCDEASDKHLKERLGL